MKPKDRSFQDYSTATIHYFNPGHETAILHASKYYHPPAVVAKMQADLSFLPAWYAFAADFVFMETTLPDDFISSVKSLRLSVTPITPDDLTKHWKEFSNLEIDLWGISPQSIHYFNKLNEERKLSLRIPEWRGAFRFLGSRFAAQKVLAGLIETVSGIEPGILPCFLSNIEDLEKRIIQGQDKQLIKSPYSSSGRGLLWLPSGKLGQSERQILGGMLKKQSHVSIEKALDKRIDFSMHFQITVNRETKFIGYSVFHTNAKGAYEKSHLARQEALEEYLTDFVDKDLLLKIRAALTGIIQEMYAPHYAGNLGIDMMVYRSGDQYRLHPCVEINMRKSMGYLAIRLAENYLHPDSRGEFLTEYNSDPLIAVRKHEAQQKQYPLIINDGFIRSGYLNLCPITSGTNYAAYIIVEP